MITGKTAPIDTTGRIATSIGAILSTAVSVSLWLGIVVSPSFAQTDGPHAEPADSTQTAPAPVQVGLTSEELLRPTISPTAAVLMTPVFPGWGQLYARNGWRAALAFGVEMFYLSHMMMNEMKADRTQAFSETLPDGSPQRDFYATQSEEFRERVRDFGWWAFAGLLIIALDAYVGAHLFQFDDDAIPVPNAWPAEKDQRDKTTWGMGLEPTQVVLQWRLSF